MTGEEKFQVDLEGYLIIKNVLDRRRSCRNERHYRQHRTSRTPKPLG